MMLRAVESIRRILSNVVLGDKHTQNIEGARTTYGASAAKVVGAGLGFLLGSVVGLHTAPATGHLAPGVANETGKTGAFLGACTAEYLEQKGCDAGGALATYVIASTDLPKGIMEMIFPDYTMTPQLPPPRSSLTTLAWT